MRKIQKKRGNNEQSGMKSPDEDVRKAQKLKKNSLPMLYDAHGTLTLLDCPKSCKEVPPGYNDASSSGG